MKKRALLIDDDEAFCHFIEKYAQEAKFPLDVVHSLSDAEKMVEERDYSAYLMDCYLPDGQGFDLLEKLKKRGLRARIALISVGFGDAKSFKELKERFQIDYILTKPLQEEDVVNLLEWISEERIERGGGEDYLADLREEYCALIPEKLSLLEEFIKHYTRALDQKSLKNVEMLIHKIGGSAGSYGYPQVSTLCKETEHYLKEVPQPPRKPMEVVLYLEEIFQKIKIAFQRPQLSDKQKGSFKRELQKQADIYIATSDRPFIAEMKRAVSEKRQTIMGESSFELARSQLGRSDFEIAILLVSHEIEGRKGRELIARFKEKKKQRKNK